MILSYKPLYQISSAPVPLLNFLSYFENVSWVQDVQESGMWRKNKSTSSADLKKIKNKLELLINCGWWASGCVSSTHVARGSTGGWSENKGRRNDVQLYLN